MYSLGLLLVQLTTGHVIRRRGDWHMPAVPEDCPQVRGARRRVPQSGDACCLRWSALLTFRPSSLIKPACHTTTRTPSFSSDLQEVADLITECIQADPAARPLASEALYRLRAAAERSLGPGAVS